MLQRPASFGFHSKCLQIAQRTRHSLLPKPLLPDMIAISFGSQFACAFQRTDAARTISLRDSLPFPRLTETRNLPSTSQIAIASSSPKYPVVWLRKGDKPALAFILEFRLNDFFSIQRESLKPSRQQTLSPAKPELTS